MNNINPYNELYCRSLHEKFPFFDQIKSDFDVLYWSSLADYKMKLTPRQSMGIRAFSMIPFYYLEKLLEKNPANIYDLGCGWNIFKKYIPNIIGVSPTHDCDNHADIHDLVDDMYIQAHQNFFESVFSINALHFVPLSDLEKVIKDFVSMIKPGGRGFLALNLARMIDRSSVDFLKTHVGPTLTCDDYNRYIRNVLTKIDINYLIVDVDLAIGDWSGFTFNEPVDGNIRLVFEKE
jgi:hypothetical protein